jgi:hypothetical protein
METAAWRAKRAKKFGKKRVVAEWKRPGGKQQPTDKTPPGRATRAGR